MSTVFSAKMQKSTQNTFIFFLADLKKRNFLLS